jgi:hypothetical protein
LLIVKYLPILEVRPAEMLALRELPEKDKDLLCPLFSLRPWVSSNKLQNSVDKIRDSFGRRACYLAVGDEELIDPSKRRDVHDELDDLRDASNGYDNWFRYLSQPGRELFRPVAQTTNFEEFPKQVTKLASLGRGLLVRIKNPQPELVANLAATISGAAQGTDLVILLDFGKQGHEFANRDGFVRDLIKIVSGILPAATIAVAASSFPEGFTSITKQDIFERSLYEKVKAAAGSVVFSDRGSARAEKQLGGGGLPAPRIDFAASREWIFFRDDGAAGGTPFQGYQRQAKILMGSGYWDPKLKLWACQMIEKTAVGDEKGGISSPNRSTAARINMHLHRQLHYGDQAGFYDTDEDWVG